MTVTPKALPNEQFPPDWWTLREIDRHLDRPKGTAFRVFRSLAEGRESVQDTGWREGRHFRLFRRHEDPRNFALLSPRLYAGSQTAILLSPDMVSALETLA